MRAKWSAFFVGLSEADRLTLQRMREVSALSIRGEYTRIDFVDKWARKEVVWKLQQWVDGARAGGDNSAAILEADVNPLRRFLSDHGTANVSTSPRIAWFDLETDSRCSFANAVNGDTRILSWAFAAVVDGEPKIIASRLLEADSDVAERALIEEFLEVAIDYDVLCAWSGDGFDFPVLAKRADALRVKLRGMRPLWNRWCWLDCLEVFKKYHAHVHESGEEKTSYKLNSIAQAVVGEGKTDFSAAWTWDAWAAGGDERERLLRYNEQDTLLMPKIEAQTGYIALHVAVCSVTRCFPDSYSLRASQQGDGFLLRLGEIHGYRWPTKRGVEEADQYSGAFVMEPTRTGIIDNVHVCDFAALYPSIMRSWNISPETVLYRNDEEPAEGSIRLPHTDGVRFSRTARGMFPRALDELVAKRAEYSKRQDAAEPGSEEWERYKRLSGAYKIVANSFYGIMGSPFARFFSSNAAEAVTQTGAWLIKRVAAASDAHGLNAFYGDTDSCFVSGDAESFSTVVRELNESWQPILAELGCTECHIKLEFEKSFSRIVLVSAKRYIGRFSVYKGKPVAHRKVEVKGLEYKRGDTMRFARTMQKELIDLLLDDELPTVERVATFVESWRQRVLAGDLSIEDIVLSQSVKTLSEYSERYTSTSCAGGKGKAKCKYKFASTEISKEAPKACPRCGTERKKSSPPVHVRVAKILAERGEEIRNGTRVEYLIVSAEGERLEAVPARDPGSLEKIDRAYYWHARIYPPTARLLESAFPDVTWTETGGEKKQRRKAEAIDRNRGDFGPLFSSADAVFSSADVVTITLDRELDKDVDMRELRRVLLERRGDRPVVLRFVGATEEVTTLRLERYPVDPSNDTIALLERICGTGTVTVSF